ncbi:hypothetical protein LQV63_11710 [Paenibacillus profundus]|uniref:Uncharacterized protein n=1 Tax=Paenibacillus profundus TaxID=1173085 RepID=A0ABS8YD82_9BACL|nr:hypothetical protein [Paenibacillus profundus]MCE5169976.1 hypothetical protein [Paenibacillus profundus]
MDGLGYAVVRRSRLRDGPQSTTCHRPVFNKEAKTNEEEFEVTASTLRRSREEFDKLALGSTSAGKTQILLIGKRLAQ